MVKSENDLNKTYAQNDNALYAKLLMGFITAVLRSEITYRTRELSHRMNNISVQKMILTLDKIIMYKVNGHYSLKYAYTSLQQEIMNALDVGRQSIEDVVESFNSTITYKIPNKYVSVNRNGKAIVFHLPKSYVVELRNDRTNQIVELTVTEFVEEVTDKDENMYGTK